MQCMPTDPVAAGGAKQTSGATERMTPGKHAGSNAARPARRTHGEQSLVRAGGGVAAGSA
jgi:hypothetical protein